MIALKAEQCGISGIIQPRGALTMILCDVCGETKDCSKKVIEGMEYDVCADCWNPLAEKLKGKGRPVKQEREMVLLPPLQREPEQPLRPKPLEPPKITGDGGRLQ
jgi:ribosome-binding protein aMBF1 (putative translation factor)